MLQPLNFSSLPLPLFLFLSSSTSRPLPLFLFQHVHLHVLLRKTLLQAHLAPLLQGLQKLQYESKAVSSELDAAATGGGLMQGEGQRQQQLREKAQALQLCVNDLLKQVIPKYSRKRYELSSH